MWLVRRLVWNPISLFRLNTIRKANFNNYITVRHSDKFAWCSKCETLKCPQDALTIGTKTYDAHQLNHFKNVNMQEVHCNNY